MEYFEKNLKILIIGRVDLWLPVEIWQQINDLLVSYRVSREKKKSKLFIKTFNLFRIHSQLNKKDVNGCARKICPMLTEYNYVCIIDRNKMHDNYPRPKESLPRILHDSHKIFDFHRDGECQKCKYCKKMMEVNARHYINQQKVYNRGGPFPFRRNW